MATSEASTSNETTCSGEDINALIGRGKKHLICNEIVEAVSCFGDASYHAGAKYGQTGDECAECYYLYGSALLELSRMENGVLGNALTGVKVKEEGPEDEFTDVEGPKISEISEEERDKVKTDVQDAMEAKDSETKDEGTSKDGEQKEEKMEEGEKMEVSEDKGEGLKSEEKQKSDEKAKENEKETVAEEKGEGSESDKVDTEEKMEEGEMKDAPEEKGADTDNKEGEGEEDEALGDEIEDEDVEGAEEGEDVDKKDNESGSEENKGDDVPTLQLSWEMLELAKVIYAKQEGQEARKKEAQALEKLGEISLEQEQYGRAVKDLQDCLKLVEGIYEPDSRALAEIHYNLGLAFNFDNKFEDAATQFKKSVEIINLKLKSLEEQIKKAEEGTKGKGKASADDPCQAARKEVKELEALLPELNAKIEDAEEMKKSAKAMAEAASDAIKMTIGLPSSDESSSSPFDAGFGFEEKPTDVKADEIKNADDITHLVRRKRKPEEEKPEENQKEEVPAKKAKPSSEEKPAEEINGNAELKKQNGDKVVTNGDSTIEPVST